MKLFELMVIAIGVSMDAFAVSICKGLSVQKVERRHFLSVGLWFGGAQAFMPLMGYLLGVSFRQVVESIDHWIAFVLLGIIGINMIRESFDRDSECDDDFSFGAMLMLAIASSIDALAVGVTFAFLNVKILPVILFIGMTTFFFSMLGIKIGNRFGARYKSKAELAGGIILVIMGAWILIEHTLLS